MYYSETSSPTYDKIKVLVDKLRSRQLTGNDALKAVTSAIQSNNAIATDILFKCITKNLTIGAKAKVINKAIPGLIPVFELALCNKLGKVKSTLEDDIEYVKSVINNRDWFVSAKLDGIRCLTIIKDGNVSMYSRSGKEIYNTSVIKGELEYSALDNVVLDGELMATDWNLTNSITRSKEVHPFIDKLKYHIFDVIKLDDFVLDKPVEPVSLRVKHLEAVCEDSLIECRHITQVHQLPVVNFDVFNRYYENVLSNGYEGVVIKESTAGYPKGRSDAWLKYKPFRSEDLVVTSYSEGEGLFKGLLGSVTVSYNGVSVDVGSGFSESQRKALWNKKEELVGRIAEVQAAPMDTVEGKLLFPVFLRFRDDK